MTHFFLTRLYVAARMLLAGSMEAEVSFNKQRASVAYEHLCDLYRGFSGPMSLDLIEAKICNVL